MTEKLKNIIETAERANEPCSFSEFLIIPTNEAYNGFWGENGFDNMIVLGGSLSEDKWFEISKCDCDSFHITWLKGINFDSPSDLGCLRAFFDEPIEILISESSILAKGGQE